MRFLSLGCAVCMLMLCEPAWAQHAKPNPQMQAVLDALEVLGPKPLETLTPKEARTQPGPGDAVRSVAVKAGKSVEPEAVGSFKDVTYPAAEGSQPARVYTPKGNGPFPVLVYYHGGGWVIGDIDAYDASCRALCNAAGAIVVSCDYRHAPESPYPAAADDAFAAYVWVLKNAKQWNGDTQRIAIAGESAGGNLAAVTCIRARDEGIQLPVHQLLVYPVTNDNMATASYTEHAKAKPLNKAMMQWFFAHYLGEHPATHSAAFPLKAKTLKNLPAATIITADIDPLLDDGKSYAEALKDAGVKVTYKNYEGVTHEFFGMGAVVDDAKEAVNFAATELKSSFEK